MDERLDKAGVGRAKLAARVRRISLLRKRVIGATLAVFALLSAGMAAGEALPQASSTAAGTSRSSVVSGEDQGAAPAPTQVSPDSIAVVPVAPDPVVTQQS